MLGEFRKVGNGMGAAKRILFEKGKIGKMELRNRVVMSPMVTNYCTEDGRPTERYMAYHEARAKGGVGLLTVEATYVTLAGRGFPNEAGLHKDDVVEDWKKYTARMHAQGAKCSVQLYHAGRQTSTAATGMELEAPSAIPCPIMQGQPKELTVARIHELVNEFGEAARRAKEAGFDAVEVHGAHGYLINEFLSPYSNKRTDEYGGSAEKRERFPLEIVQRIREVVGPDFPIIYRISTDEFVEGGLTIQDTCEFCKHLVAAGIDAIHCSGGVYQTAYRIIQPAPEAVALYADNAAAIKQAIGGAVPVMVAGRIKDYDVAEGILEDGKADFIVMGRALLADPEVVHKMEEGRFSDIRRCLSCNQACIDKLFVGLPIGCMINPMTGHEYEYDLSPVVDKKKVLVVGAGPGGLEAARVAALRGHSVTLCEKQDHLGGQMVQAAEPPYKDALKVYLDYQVQTLKDLKVDVQCGKEITAEDVKAMGADEVILATGSDPIRLNVPGIDLPCVAEAHDVLDGAKTGDVVAVIGGGLVGCETAEFLLEQGKKVLLVEMLPQIAGDMGVCALQSMMARLAGANLEIHTSSKLKAICDDGIIVEKDGQEEKLGGVDTVVMAVGSKSNKTLEEDLKAAGIAYHAVGDCVKAPGQILTAVLEAFNTARML